MGQRGGLTWADKSSFLHTLRWDRMHRNFHQWGDVMRRSTIPVLTLVLLTCLGHKANGAQPSPTNLDSLIAQSRAALVQVMASGSVMGTGFITSPDGFVATANHVVTSRVIVGNRTVVRYLPNIQVKLSDGRTLAAEPAVAISNESVIHDYVFLKTRERNLPYLNLGTWNEVTEGDHLTTLGYALNSPSPLLITATVAGRFAIPSSADGSMVNAILFQGPANRGLSGAPLISNATGNVVGIVTDKLVGLSPELQNVKNQIKTARRQGSVQIMGVETNDAMLAIIELLDAHLISGMGAAVAIDYAKDAMILLLERETSSQREQ